MTLLWDFAANSPTDHERIAQWTCHTVRPKYAQRWLSEFEYRFNRRFDLPDTIPRFVYVALRTPPMPERLLQLRLA